MNVKETHIVTGMSRDSSVAQQNPNLVYDAHNIRITTKDGSNSLLSVTNERGTKAVSITSGSSTIDGTPIGDAIIDKYIVLFTHNNHVSSNKDHIYRCEMIEDTMDIITMFEGDADFDLEHPIQTLPIYENDNLQKVYWVDGKNQPRVINIARSTILRDSDFLNFSREVALAHTLSVTKYSTGGEFPVGTIQYAFSYYTKFSQESCLIDVSPMYYLSPMENGLDATDIAHCSFEIKISSPDSNFDYVRIYAIVRTSANTIPQCRVVGDYAIADSSTPIIATDDGIKGSTYPAASMYFIGGEELIAGTLAEKDNTLFLGDITLTKPNAGDVVLDGEGNNAHSIRYYVNEYAAGRISQSNFGNAVGNIVSSNIGYSPDGSRVPTNATKYYDYNPNNNRSSYYIRRFKYRETYRLGFIAQYKNGQWSEPIWVGDFENNYAPQVAPQGGVGRYSTGCFHLNMPQNIITKLKDAGFKRIAPVVVYPQAHERRCVMQGLLCPTMYNTKDRQDNSPYAQSSWFFRLYHNVTQAEGSLYWHHAPIGNSGTPRGEIQCIDVSQQGASTFYMDGNVVTFHSPDIECVDVNQNTDFEGLDLNIVGFASASISNATDLGDIARVTDHFLETENVGIKTNFSQIITMRRTGYNGYSMDNYCYPLYFDGVVQNENNDEVIAREGIRWEYNGQIVTLVNPACGWIVYPWHRQGSLNNQQALSTKQRSNGFNTRTAMLKRNITANAWFTNTVYFNPTYVKSLASGVKISTPKLFNFDQLASVKISDGSDSAIYYGNIDKVITSANGKYPIYYGWCMSADNDAEIKNLTESSENAMTKTRWESWEYNDDGDCYTGADPVSMKYKSSPHAVLKFNGDTIHIPMSSQDNTHLAFTNTGATGSGLWIAELIRNVDPITRFGGKSEQAFVSNNWIRCGESKDLDTWYHATSYLEYQQGDCYIQRYDCLKTYPFTNEDMNSIIETLSATLETYVNLDFRYDHNRGSGKNVALSPINFNLYNHSAYEQVNNFFTYHGLDYNRYVKGAFPNGIAWTLSKNFGEDVDTWTSIDVTNMTELDGSRGGVTGIIQYKNDLYAFQKGAFARLLFNNRVQIPTSDNTPIEITNGMKMQGVQYISEKIGCTNKWSIVETPLGVYFNDDILKATYLFNGQLTDLSTSKGMKSWMNESCRQAVWNPSTFANCRAFYDKIGRDIYWVYSNTALVYSEIIGQYMSFMDYGSVPLIESIGNSTYAVLSNYNEQTEATLLMRTSDGGMGVIIFSLSASYAGIVHVQVEWRTGDNPRNPRPPASVTIDTSGNEITLSVIAYTCESYSSDLYKPIDIARAITSAIVHSTELSGIVSAVPGGNYNVPIMYRYSDQYTPLDAYLTNSKSSPFWELGRGEYNEFFGHYRPHWITFISNSYPTENKIYNNVSWRDIVHNNITPKPFHTFDHIRVWTEHQDTLSVRFNNELSEDSERQPISYDAASSNLRKKFNVWHCQIPRDRIAPNTSRARISNPWCYIKLSREDAQIERHELMNLDVNFFM